MGRVTGYYHRDGITNIKTATYKVEVPGTVPVKLGAAAVLREWAHPVAPDVMTIVFSDYGVEHLVLEVWE